MRVREPCAFGRDPVHMGRRDQRFGIVASGIPEAHVIGHDEDDIRRLLPRPGLPPDGLAQRPSKGGRAEAEGFQKIASIHSDFIRRGIPFLSSA